MSRAFHQFDGVGVDLTRFSDRSGDNMGGGNMRSGNMGSGGDLDQT